MDLKAIELVTIEELYAFVESAVARTALILDHDALYRPWARLVSSASADLRWLYPARPIPEIVMQHLGNFAQEP